MTFSSKYMMQLTLKTIVIMMHHLFYFYVWRLEMKERNTNRTRSKLKGFAAKIILWEKKGKYQSLDKQQKSNKIKESRILRTRQMIGRDIFLGEAPSRAITEKLAKVVRGVDAVVQSRPLFLIIILPARYGHPTRGGWYCFSSSKLHFVFSAFFPHAEKCLSSSTGGLPLAVFLTWLPKP